LVTLITLNKTLSIGRVSIQSLMAILVGLFLTNSGDYFILLVFSLAIAHGLGIAFYETLVAKTTKNSPTLSLDIGLLIIPQRLAEFTSIIFAAFAAQYFGYMPIFILSGILFSVYSVLSWYTLKS
jgi:hypothetical protein